MKIETVEFQRYSLPLTHPFDSSRGELSDRDGYLVRLTDEHGYAGIGDVAPLPDFGTETQAEAESLLKELASGRIALSVSDPTIRSVHSALARFADRPAVRFGLEQALLGLISAGTKVTLPDLLYLRPADTIAVSAVIGLRPPNEVVELATQFVQSRYSTIKLKIGRESFSEDLRCVEALRKVSPNVKLRLDVNGMWTLKQATENMPQLAGYNIEYIEQPLPVPLDPELALLREESGIPVAVDESLRTFNDALRLIELKVADLFIVKPVGCGGILETLRIVHTAKEHNLPVVISSMLESSVGRRLVVLAAAGTESPYAHGIATGQLFGRDITTDPFPVTDGSIRTGDIAGFVPNEKIYNELT
jgi:L-Ala-D/L-Glu epimerase